jgi:hypothetical protein
MTAAPQRAALMAVIIPELPPPITMIRFSSSMAYRFSARGRNG